MTKHSLRLKNNDWAITCSAGYFHRKPVGLGKYFSGTAANDNRLVSNNFQTIYIALIAIGLTGAALFALR